MRSAWLGGTQNRCIRGGGHQSGEIESQRAFGPYPRKNHTQVCHRRNSRPHRDQRVFDFNPSLVGWHPAMRISLYSCYSPHVIAEQDRL